MERGCNTSMLHRYVHFAIVVLHRLLTSKHAPQVFHSGSVLILAQVCIKSHGNIQSVEADTIRFVAQHTTIPVPKIYHDFVHDGRLYIVMQRLDGEPASNGWTERTAESKARIHTQLRTIVEQLRQVRPPTGVGVANVALGPIFDQRLPKTSLWGPFKSIDDFHRKLRNDFALTDIEGDATFLSQHDNLTALIRFHQGSWSRSVLTHGDLSSFNILVNQDEVVGIIDWETAGWMPPYWEYTNASMVSPQNEFWQCEVDHFLTPDPEALTAERCRKQLFGDF